MTPHQIIAVAARLFAIWLFALIVMNIPYYFLNTQLQGESDSVIAFVLGAAVVFFLTFVLWKFPLTVAGKLLSSNTQESESRLQPDLWLAMGCALMGLWMLASTIPAFVQSLDFSWSDLGGGYSDSFSIWLGLFDIGIPLQQPELYIS